MPFERWRGRTAIRFLVRSLDRRGGAFLLSLLAISVSATVTAALLDVRADLAAKMSRELRAYGPNLLVVPAAPAASLDESAARAAADASGTAAWAPILLASGTVAADGGAPLPAAMVGSDWERLRLLNPSWRIDAAAPPPAAAGGAVPAGAGAPMAGVVVGEILARRAGLRPGDVASLRIAGPASKVRVAGVVTTGEGEDEELFLPLGLLQDSTGSRGRLALLALAVDGGLQEVERRAGALQAAIPGSRGLPLRPVAAAQGALLFRLGRMMLLMTLVVVVLSALCLMITLSGTILERAPEIGLQRSLGAGDGAIRFMFLGEVALLGTGGAAAGLVTGALAARLIGMRLFGAAIAPRAAAVPWTLAVTFLVCAAAALVPLRRVLAIQPATALRGD